MAKNDESWNQYGINRHIQRNSLTKEFRCVTCGITLGDNPGGAGMHSKGSHGLRIDGSPIQEKPVNEVKSLQSPTTYPVKLSPELKIKPQEKLPVKPAQRHSLAAYKKSMEMYNRIGCKPSQSPSHISMGEYSSSKMIYDSLSKDPSLVLYEDMEKKKAFLIKYKELERAGATESMLRPYRVAQGMEEDYQEMKLEKERKQIEKNNRERWDNVFYFFSTESQALREFYFKKVLKTYQIDLF